MDRAKKLAEIAEERYKIIAEIVFARRDGADPARVAELKKQTMERSGISRKTLNRWLDDYASNGFEGLKPQLPTNTMGKFPAEWLAEAIQLRRELPSRSILQIIDIMESEGTVPKGKLKRATLQNNLAKAGYSTARMKQYTQKTAAARRFQRSERNDMWQSDVKYGPYITVDGEVRQIYLVCFIDDATRFITHAEFYDTLDQSIVEDCFRKAIMKCGLPDRVFFDNGSQYRTHWMQRACAVMEIKLIFAAPYSPESKGKVERFNRTVGSFFQEAALKKPHTLDEYNELLKIWLSECYHNREHGGTGTIPEAAWNGSAKPLRFMPAETIASAFLHVEKRKVDKSGCISFRGVKYETSVTLIGRAVDVVYDLTDTSAITIEDAQLGISIAAKPLVVGEHSGPRPKIPERMSEHTPETSRLLDAKAENYKSRRTSVQRAISFAGKEDENDV
jgi:transposase InsO family protein